MDELANKTLIKKKEPYTHKLSVRLKVLADNQNNKHNAYESKIGQELSECKPERDEASTGGISPKQALSMKQEAITSTPKVLGYGSSL